MLYLLRFLSIRYWLQHRGAFFLATLGVTLGIAVFVSIQVANHSVLAAFAASLDAVSGKANLQIRGGSGGIPEEVYARLRTQPGRDIAQHIQAAAPLLSITAFSPSLKRNPRERGTTLLVMGVDLFAENEFRDYHLEDQRVSSGEGGAAGRNTSANARSNATRALVQFLLEPDAIAISEALAQKYALRVGSPLQLFIGAKRKTMRVCTILRGESLNRAFGGDFALLDIATAQEVFERLGQLSQIDLIVDEEQIPSITRSLQRLVPIDATVQRPAQRGAQVADLLAAFQLNLSALSCIALFVGAFLIYNTIAIAVVRRRAEAGILRSFGTAQNQLMRLFCIEAAFIGLIGSLLGLLLGIGLARFTLRAVSTTVSALYIEIKANQLEVPLWLWWAAPLGGTLLAALAAWPAAREAAHTSPRAALSGVTLHHTTTRFARPLALGGLVLLGLAFLLCQPFFSARSAFIGFGAIFFTLAGFSLLTPLFTLWGGRAARVVGGRIFGIEGVLAGSYLQRALNRTGLVIAALMVSLAMTIGMAVMVTSFRGTVSDWVDATISADLFIAPAGGFTYDPGPGLPPEVVRFATTLEGVRSYDTIRGASTVINNQPVYLAANSLPALRTGDRRLRFVETVGTAEAAILEFTEARAVLVSERFKNILGYGAGDQFTLQTPRGPLRLKISGVFYDYTPDKCVIYLPQPIYRRYWNDTALDGIALYLKPGVTTESVQRLLDERYGRRYQLSLLPNREIRKSVFITFDQTFAVTYALQLIAIIVAAIGIFDTLIALILERGRELATLRALGASRGQIGKLAYIEFALIGLFAWIIGSGAGLCLAWQLINVINRQFFGWTIGMTVPPLVLIQALVLALAAALASGVLPARAAARRDIAAALQVE